MKKLSRKDAPPLTDAELTEIDLYDLDHPENIEKGVRTLARELGIDPDEFARCVLSGVPPEHWPLKEISKRL